MIPVLAAEAFVAVFIGIAAMIYGGALVNVIAGLLP